MPNITVRRCTTLNAATLLPTQEDGEEHQCCLTALEQVCTPRPDLSDVPLENCEMSSLWMAQLLKIHKQARIKLAMQ